MIRAMSSEEHKIESRKACLRVFHSPLRSLVSESAWVVILGSIIDEY